MARCSSPVPASSGRPATRVRLGPYCAGQSSSIAHLEENMAAIELELDDGDLAALDRVEQRDDG
jgi:hypothetical protein